MTDTWFSGIFPGSKRPAEIQTTVAHPARVYDYWLGGKDNFAADREAAERVLAIAPGLRSRVQANRLSSPGRCASWRPTAIPAVPRHRHRHPDRRTTPTRSPRRPRPPSRIVYVDNDPIVLAHARALLTSSPEGATAYLEADLREPDTILAAAPRPWTSASPSRSCCSGSCT